MQDEKLIESYLNKKQVRAYKLSIINRSVNELNKYNLIRTFLNNKKEDVTYKAAKRVVQLI